MVGCPYCGEELFESQEKLVALNLFACRACLNAYLVRFSGDKVSAEKIPGEQDFREAVPPDSVMGGVFGELGAAVNDLPMLPEVGQRVSGMLHDPLMSMRELADVLREAPQVSLRLLKLANSAAYASASEIKEIEVACARLGLRTVANTVTTVLHGSMYRTSNAAHRGMMQNFWRHAVLSALYADGLSSQDASTQRHNVYESGLLHDVGMIVLLDLITNRYTGRLGRLRESMELLEKVLDQFHPRVGLHVAQHWEVSQAARFAVYFHKHDAPPDVDGNAQALDIVRTSSDLAHSVGFGLRWENNVDLEHLPAAERIGLTTEDLLAFRTDYQEKADAALSIFCA